MACSWAPDSSKIATAGADGVVAICTCHFICLADNRGRIDFQIHPDLQRRIRYPISAERDRLRQPQHHCLSLFVWCIERL